MALVSGPLMEIILFVQEMESEVQFYRDLLGLRIRFPQNLQDYSKEMWVEFETGDCILALHGGARQKPDKVHSIVFTVDNIEQARETILNAGIEISDIRPLEDGSKVAEGLDPAGHPFSIRT